MRKTTRMSRGIAAIGTSALIFSVAVAADKEVQLSEVPAAVKAVIDEKVKGAPIGEIELEDEDGRQIYSVEFTRDGKEIEIEIATNGDFLGEEVEDEKDDNGDDGATTGTEEEEGDDDENEQKIDPASAPDAVKAALKPILQGVKLKALIKETENGKTVYEAEYDVDGQENSVEVSENGDVLEIERSVGMDNLPDAVRDAALKSHKDTLIKSAEIVEKKSGKASQKFYEIKVRAGGKMHEIKIDESGKVLSSEDDE